jgi:2-dehydro-3-deoxygluconokinase
VAGSMRDIICLGEPLYELNQQPDGRFLPGFGGDTSNVAIAAARLGARTGVIALVGADLFGDALLDLWRGEGVDVPHVRRLDTAPTGVYFVTHSSTGHAFTYLRAGSAASCITPQDIPPEAIAGTQFLHVSVISQAISVSASDTVSHAMSLARSAGARLSYDTNLRLRLWPLDRARLVIAASAAVADVLKTSRDDAEVLTGLSEPNAIAEHFLNLGSHAVIVTLGLAGALLLTHDLRQVIPAYPAQTVDATGAGDAFTGALLFELCAGRSLSEGAHFASAAAAVSTNEYGAVGPLPRRDAVTALLESGAG